MKSFKSNVNFSKYLERSCSSIFNIGNSLANTYLSNVQPHLYHHKEGALYFADIPTPLGLATMHDRDLVRALPPGLSLTKHHRLPMGLGPCSLKILL